MNAITTDAKIREKYDEEGRPSLYISSDKRKQDFVVQKSNDGFVFYEVKIEGGGVTPKELTSKFSRINYARDAVLKYLENATASRSVERDIKQDKRKATNATELSSVNN